ncbi:MAG: class I SAM-dependent methyltransferase [Planctomycetes bacterium]|nr:class I SAM-dependent methyltransferase [Planctomycetota bacterium]
MESGVALSRQTKAPDETERVRRHYEDLAPKYDKLIRFAEKILFRDGRRWACSQATGDVLEVAIGTGRNLPFYPAGVRLTGIELSPAMLELARQRANELGREVELRVGDAQALDFPDHRFDTVVCTLSLCCIPNDRKAVAEMKRVLRFGGQLVLLDHVASDVLLVRAVQRLLEPLSVRFGADSLLRRPLEHVRAEGFEIKWQERSNWGIVERVIARKPPEC